MRENAIDSIKPASDDTQPKAGCKGRKKAKPAKKTGRAKKAASRPKTDGTNKKAEVIAMMKRAKGATLREIMKATGWQPHTVQASTDRTVPSTYRLVIPSLKVGRRGNQFKRNAFA